MKCILKVNDAHELRKQCQQSDVRLRELYGKVEKTYNVNLCKITNVSIYIFVNEEYDYMIIIISFITRINIVKLIIPLLLI